LIDVRALRNHLWLLVALALIGLSWWLETRPRQREESAPPPIKQTQRQKYEALKNCVLVEHKDNDGDSFLVRHDGGMHTFRLHFADAPEKRRHQYNGDRLRHQARYFGDLTEQQVIEIGQQARATVAALLQELSFTIHTKWREVYDSDRFYAFVLFSDGESLTEKLVKEGLVRIYTEGAPHPDGRSEKVFRAHLMKLEAEARRAKRGAWGL
jgi:endonuclease YncB( thermonuclease family)